VRVKRILVTGAYGFLGPILCASLETSGHLVFRQGRKSCAQVQCDPGKPEEFQGILDHCAPDVVINLVAKADVDGCEIDPVAAAMANVDVVHAVASAMKGRDIHLVHLSTDHLYCGPGPSAEDRITPINVYARTKYQGELAAAEANATILRTNFVGHSVVSGRRSLSDWIVGQLRARERFTVFRDVFFSPLHVSTVCTWIEVAALRQVPGTFNLGARGGVSKAEFAFALANLLEEDAGLMTVGDYTDVLQRAKRPRDMTMAVERFEQAFACTLPAIQNEIELLARDYATSKK
jgi:dTDP-4-dehydrorhamnose reductase